MKNELEGLKFIQLVKVDNVYNFYKDEEEGIIKSKVEFFAVYLRIKDSLLEFFPIEKSHFIDGFMQLEDYQSNFLDTIDLSHSHWLPLTDEDKKNGQVQYLLKDNEVGK
jgi:hypothetical protein